MTRAGLIAIVGLPNAGKSSLLNSLLGTKLSIVTSAAQTTRERVVGIDTRDGVQMVFLDTPGIVDPAYLLHRSMLSIVEETISDADVVVFVLDGTRGPPEIDARILERLQAARSAIVPVVNKADVAPAGGIAELVAWSSTHFDRVPVEISATTGEGIDVLREAIGAVLPESPYLYPEEDLSSQNLRFFTAELIREAIFEEYAEEIPYSAAVVIDEFREEGEPAVIRATVFVERESQKGILIGSKGAAIRRLGIAARLKVEALLGRRVYLEMRVKVLPKWRKKEEQLRRLGFPIPKKPR